MSENRLDFKGKLLILTVIVLICYVYLQYKTINLIDEMLEHDKNAIKANLINARATKELDERVKALEYKSLPWWKRAIEAGRENLK
jgi:predicted Holliday junction resolvase-like endonuclease